MRRVGYIGEGAFSKRLPYADFFGYFLVRKQESNIPRLLDKLQLIAKPPRDGPAGVGMVFSR